MGFIEELKNLDACIEGIDWASTQSSAQSMWDNCERGDWLLWLCGKLSGNVGSDSRKKLVWTACQCARLALPYIISGNNVPMITIETAEIIVWGGLLLKK